jgi:uncharacterized protein YggE
MNAEIVVCGTAQGRALPDRAVLRAVVEGDGASREDAYQQATGPAGEVDAVLAARGAALDRVTTAALLVHPRTRWRKGENVRTGWRASRTTAVEVADLSVVGDLIAELATAGAAVSGPYWHLDPANPVHAEVRGLAAADARSRAEAYAGALRIELAGVAWVAEPGLRGGSDTHFGGVAMGMSLPAPGGAAPEAIEVAVDEMTVEARVEVGFTIAG